MQAFEREVCQRLPLADAVFRLLDFCTADGFLNDLFRRYRGRSYEAILTFPQFVHLLADTLLGRQRSAHQLERQRYQVHGTPPERGGQDGAGYEPPNLNRHRGKHAEEGAANAGFAIGYGIGYGRGLTGDPTEPWPI